MASNTQYLNLYKKDPVADASDTFNITTMLNENWDKLDAAWLARIINGKTITTATLSAGTWDETNKTYSFETQYPSSTYDVEIEPGQTCTEEQLSAWTRAKLVGSASSNILTAVGEVPAVDIPIIVKVVIK